MIKDKRREVKKVVKAVIKKLEGCSRIITANDFFPDFNALWNIFT